MKSVLSQTISTTVDSKRPTFLALPIGIVPIYNSLTSGNNQRHIFGVGISVVGNHTSVLVTIGQFTREKTSEIALDSSYKPKFEESEYVNRKTGKKASKLVPKRVGEPYYDYLANKGDNMRYYIPIGRDMTPYETKRKASVLGLCSQGIQSIAESVGDLATANAKKGVLNFQAFQKAISDIVSKHAKTVGFRA